MGSREMKPQDSRTRQWLARPFKRVALLLARHPKRAAFLSAVLLTLELDGCERSSLNDGLPATLDCTACHGSKANAAPPKAIDGSVSTTDIGVGAHQEHLVAGHIAAPVACTECHPLPTDLLSHPDPLSRPATVVFGAKAQLYGAVPGWNRAAARCTNTYCHGAKLSDASARADPIWNQVDGTQRSCRSCHGYPPAGSHPHSDACADCHGEVVNPDGTIRNLSRHIDGNVDFFVPVADAGAGSSGGSGAVDSGTGGGP